MNTEMHYRLADGVAIRPERFGGLVYDYRTRRLYFIHSHPLADFVGGLRADDSLARAIEDFLSRSDRKETTAEAIVRTLSALEGMGLLVRVDAPRPGEDAGGAGPLPTGLH